MNLLALKLLHRDLKDVTSLIEKTTFKNERYLAYNIFQKIQRAGIKLNREKNE